MSRPDGSCPSPPRWWGGEGGAQGRQRASIGLCMATNPSKIVSKSRPSTLIQAPTLKKSSAPSQLTIENLLAETQQYLAPTDLERIRHAYNLAHQAHEGTIRRTGEAYIQHPLEVAYL